MRPTPLPTSETLRHGAGSNGVDNCTPMCRQRSLARGLGDLSTFLQKVHVQEMAYLLQPAVVSRGTLNSQQNFTPMTSARAFRSHCLQLSVPSYLNATPQAIEQRSICPLNSTHRPKRIRSNSSLYHEGLLHCQLLKPSDTVPAAMGSITALQCAGKEALQA